jgi:hypothetical protein
MRLARLVSGLKEESANSPASTERDGARRTSVLTFVSAGASDVAGRGRYASAFHPGFQLDDPRTIRQKPRTGQHRCIMWPA